MPAERVLQRLRAPGRRLSRRRSQPGWMFPCPAAHGRAARRVPRPGSGSLRRLPVEAEARSVVSTLSDLSHRRRVASAPVFRSCLTLRRLAEAWRPVDRRAQRRAVAGAISRRPGPVRELVFLPTRRYLARVGFRFGPGLGCRHSAVPHPVCLLHPVWPVGPMLPGQPVRRAVQDWRYRRVCRTPAGVAGSAGTAGSAATPSPAGTPGTAGTAGSAGAAEAEPVSTAASWLPGRSAGTPSCKGVSEISGSGSVFAGATSTVCDPEAPRKQIRTNCRSIQKRKG